MYVRVMSELVRLCVYIFYFVIILTFYSIPLPIVRDLYTSARVWYCVASFGCWRCSPEGSLFVSDCTRV